MGKHRADALRPDIEAASQKMKYRGGVRREIRKLGKYVAEDEKVLAFAKTYGAKLAVLTDRRLMVFIASWTVELVEDFPLNKINSVKWIWGFGSGTLTLVLSGVATEINFFNKFDGEAVALPLREYVSEHA